MSTSNTASHILPIALCETDGALSAPAHIQILPVGAIAPRDGRAPWRLDNPQAVIAETARYLGASEMLLDYNHQSQHAARNGRPAPAAGWITGLEVRPEGIFGKVNWTDKGAAAVAAREFRYISPVFNYDAQGRVTRILSCALTNTPALDMAALCETTPAKENDMDARILAQALGLAETASEAEIVAACAEARKAMAETQKEPDPASYVPIAAHNAVMAELAALKKAQCEAEAAALVADAKAKGKLMPAMETWATAYAQSNPEGFKTWLEAAPDLGLDREKVQGKPGGEKGPNLTGEQRALCQAMNLDEARYLEEIRSMEAANG